jgi:paraquat-inducible protein A
MASQQLVRSDRAGLGSNNEFAFGSIACHECDLIHKVVPLGYGQSAKCTRCGAVLYRQKRDSLDRSLNFTVTGLILFALSNAFPFMTIEIEGRRQSNTLISGALEFWRSGFEGLAVIVLLMSVLLPLFTLLGMLYILLPLKLGRRPWRLRSIFRYLEVLRPWAMMEVYMLGVLVALVKLADFATVIPGLSLYAFAALIIVTAAASAALDPRIVWAKLSAGT